MITAKLLNADRSHSICVLLFSMMVLLSAVSAQTSTQTPRPTFSFNETTSAPGPGIMNKPDGVDATSFSLAILGIFLGLAFIAGVCCFYTQRRSYRAQQAGDVVMDDEKNMYIEVKTRKAHATRDSSLWIVNSNVNEDHGVNTSTMEGYKSQKPVNLSVQTSIASSN